MEGGEEKVKSERESLVEGEAEPTSEPPPPEPPPPPPEEPPPPPPEEPPVEEPAPPPEEPAPPPEEPEPPPAVEATEPPAPASKAASLAPVAEETAAESPEATPTSDPSVKSSSASKQKVLAAEKSATGSLKSVSKSVNDTLVPSSRKDISRITAAVSCGGGGGINIPGLGNFNCSAFIQKRSPFTRNPPEPEERRDRITNPRTPREYIINLREDLADFQESHGLPRTRDYSFLSLGLALAYETARALCSLFLMFAELFPIVAIVSLLMRFALDKLIEILETSEPVPKVKKSIIFALQMLVIIIPLWIFIGTIIIPLFSLVLSIFKRMIRFKGRGRKYGAKTKACTAFDYFRIF